MLDFDTEVAPVQRKSVEGWWQLARLCLDQAADEWVNVGIVYTGADGKCTFRFLASLAGIKCHYSEDAAQDARFLIEQAQEAIEDGIAFPQNWNVRLSLKNFIRGQDAKSIVESLYKRLIPLAKHDSSDQRLDSEHHSHATASVRATVKNLLTRQLNSSSVKKFWQNRPIEVFHDSYPLRLDLQIQSSAFGELFNGAISSAWYKTNYHRIASLSQAMNATMLANDIYRDAKNFMYLLKPSEDEEFTKDEISAINKDIDGITWMLRNKNSTIRIFNTEREMAQSILQDLNSSHQLDLSLI